MILVNIIYSTLYVDVKIVTYFWLLQNIGILLSINAYLAVDQ